jgi:hypothetical protein
MSPGTWRTPIPVRKQVLAVVLALFLALIFGFAWWITSSVDNADRSEQTQDDGF